MTASAPDGIVEAIEDAARRFVIGVQWHPEYDWEHDPVSRRIFEAFGAAVRSRDMPQAAAAD